MKFEHDWDKGRKTWTGQDVYTEKLFRPLPLIWKISSWSGHTQYPRAQILSLPWSNGQGEIIKIYIIWMANRQTDEQKSEFKIKEHMLIGILHVR